MMKCYECGKEIVLSVNGLCYDCLPSAPSQIAGMGQQIQPETPAQRRVRLVEMYAGQLFGPLHTTRSESWDTVAQATFYAEELADAVIAATKEEHELD